MGKTGQKNNLVLTIVSIALAVVLLATVVFAVVIFSSNVPVGGTVTTGEMLSVIEGVDALTVAEMTDSDQNGIPVDTFTQSVAFADAGHSHTYTLTLENNTDKPMSYYYGVKLATVENGLEDVIMVYYDGQFLGMLGQLTSLGELIIDNDNFILGGTTVAPSSTTHTLTFELHIAANDSYFVDKRAEIVVTAYARSINYQQVMFVKNELEFNHAVNDIDTGVLTNAKIVLADNVTLTKEYIISHPCVIDLLGFELIFATDSTNGTNGKIIFRPVDSTGGTETEQTTKTLSLTSSAPIKSALTSLSTTPSTSVGFLVDGENALIVIDDFYKTTIDAVTSQRTEHNIGTLYGALTYIANYDKVAANDNLTEKMIQNLGGGVQSGSAVSLFEAMSFYTLSSQFVTAQAGVSQLFISAPDTADYTYTPSNSSLTTVERDVSVVSSVLFGQTQQTATPYEFKIIGNDSEATYQSLLINELAHIPNITVTGVLTNVSADLYLPTSIKSKNVTIDWSSNNVSAMDNGGKINTDLPNNTLVTLTANIRINDLLFVKTFTFRVFAQNNATKLNYLLSRINPVKLTEVGTEGAVYLPMVSGSHAYYETFVVDGSGTNSWAAYEKIGLITFDYVANNAYNYVTVDTESVGGEELYRVYLNQAVFYTYAQLDVTATFEGDVDEWGNPTVYTGIVNVIIELGGDSGLNEMVFNYIDGLLSGVDILQNILDTRETLGMANEVGDFTLPAWYMNYNISYTDNNEVISDIILNNNGTPDDISDDFYTIKIDAEKFSEANSNTLINAVIENPNLNVSDVTRALSFATPGAIHNDEEGFFDSSVFYSTKYQVWQQLSQKGLNTNNESGFVVTNGNDVRYANVKDYILLHDIAQSETLLYNNAQKYNADTDADPLILLLSWATDMGNKGDTAGSIVTTLGSSVANNESNGKEYITPDEKAVIKAFCTTIITDAEFEAIWELISTTAAGYVLDEPDIMVTQINAMVNNYNYHETKPMALFKFNEIMQWATDMRNFGMAGDPASGARVDHGPPNSGVLSATYGEWAEDHLPTISEDEKNTIFGYWYRVTNPYGAVVTLSSGTTNWTGGAWYDIWNACYLIPDYLNSNAVVRLYQAVYGKGVSNAINLKTTNVLSTLGGANFNLHASYVTCLDTAESGIGYFTNLKHLYIDGSDVLTQGSYLSPIFSNSDCVDTFFNHLSSSACKDKLETLVMRYCSPLNVSVWDITNMRYFTTLKYIDLLGNYGISSILGITEMNNVADLTFVDVRGMNNPLEFCEPFIAYIYVASGGNAEIFHSEYQGGLTKYRIDSTVSVANELVTDKAKALVALSYLDELTEMPSEYLQLVYSLFADTTYDVTWQIEQGNPLFEVDLAVRGTDTANIQTTLANINADLHFGEVLYMGENTVDYTQGTYYTLAKQNASSNVAVYNTGGLLSDYTVMNGTASLQAIVTQFNNYYAQLAAYNAEWAAYYEAVEEYNAIPEIDDAGMTSEINSANNLTGYRNPSFYRFVLSGDNLILSDVITTTNQTNATTMGNSLTNNLGTYYRWNRGANTCTVNGVSVQLTRNYVYMYDGTRVYIFGTNVIDASDVQGYHNKIYHNNDDNTYHRMVYGQRNGIWSFEWENVVVTPPTAPTTTQPVKPTPTTYTYYYDQTNGVLYRLIDDETNGVASYEVAPENIATSATEMNDNLNATNTAITTYNDNNHYYHYTGATGNGYTQNGVYLLELANGATQFSMRYITTTSGRSSDTGMLDILGNATNFDCGDYYYYVGTTLTVGGYTFTQNSVYRIARVGNTDSFVFVIDDSDGKSDTIVRESNISVFLQIPFNATSADVGDLYRLATTDTSVGGTSYHEPNRVYELCHNQSAGGYYMKLFGACSFSNEMTSSNGKLVITINNDRFYEGLYYSGTGTDEEAIISARITIGENTYVRKFKVTIQG